MRGALWQVPCKNHRRAKLRTHLRCNPVSSLAISGILIASLAGSFITAAFGIGGGILLLSVLATLLPPAAVIPVHGIVQMGSNLGRLIVFRKFLDRRAILPFAAGSLIGVAMGGVLVVEFDPALMQLTLGGFILWSLFGTPPAFFRRSALLTGVFSSFLTMFVGGTGPFVATFIKGIGLHRMAHTAKHAAFMTIQHFVKTLVFGLLGFAFSTWALLIAGMIMAGLLGTLLGRRVLMQINEALFKRILNLVLLFLALRLVLVGALGLAG